ncbi:aspartyl/asparaginyl beta-hydroxylase domain-containing protein [Ferrimonas kyonanensis]|uniref:aspartyl/asparaginyl beta-hydroxylase domain-containing protein n=1 Tax=Ferrimonas kyonanensis TaxID=364763 RepID=UPI0004158A4A|nr:aspartyl/asparaginyl beta-hydroxylase domain-containing protein [Ferrimonas kyonanensis]
MTIVSARLHRLDPELFQAEIATVAGSKLWQDHVNHQDYRGRWQGLALRCGRHTLHSHPILQLHQLEGVSDWVDLPVLERLPSLSRWLSEFVAPVGAARLLRLDPGAHILPHRDHGLGLEHQQARLHLCLEMPEDLRFIVDGQTVPMAAGELWYINADLPHEVCHCGQRPRTSLVMDCQVTGPLRQLIETAPLIQHQHQ